MKNDDCPAFPLVDVSQNTSTGATTAHQYAAAGMTLRDYFATAAMQAAATNPVGGDGFTYEQRAEWAYRQADAMLKERLK